jgi:HAD superfamily phosphatase (TIGR01668 family)
LALPHVSVPDISWVDWAAVKAAGFKVCIFDKDNTLCEPFALAVPPPLLPSFTACRSAFGGNIVLYSNSAGLQQYDPEGAEAAALEKAFDVQVRSRGSSCEPRLASGEETGRSVACTADAAGTADVEQWCCRAQHSHGQTPGSM